jgi:hypothetical protein
VIANLRLHRENVRLSLYPKEQTTVTGPLVDSLLDALGVWEETMLARFKASGSECMKAGLYYLLSITALRMEIHRLAGLDTIQQKNTTHKSTQKYKDTKTQNNTTQHN